MKYKKPLIIILLIAILLFIGAVISLYSLAISTGLSGRRGGPQDAFRHTYSTALTARYLSPKVVEFVTFATERDPSSPFDRMDIHNNRIGTNIGLGEENLYEAVTIKIKNGQINAIDANIVTWLPHEKWDNDGY